MSDRPENPNDEGLDPFQEEFGPQPPKPEQIWPPKDAPAPWKPGKPPPRRRTRSPSQEPTKPTPPKPQPGEHLWPPEGPAETDVPEEPASAHPESELEPEPLDMEWKNGVEQIDEAMEEIRRINGGPAEEAVAEPPGGERGPVDTGSHVAVPDDDFQDDETIPLAEDVVEAAPEDLDTALEDLVATSRLIDESPPIGEAPFSDSADRAPVVSESDDTFLLDEPEHFPDVVEEEETARLADAAPPELAEGPRGAARADRVAVATGRQRPPSSAGARPFHVRGKSESEIGQLWSNLFLTVGRPPPRIVVVAGVQRRDGATQVATSLALLGAAANEGVRVALIDLNLRRPDVHAQLRLSIAPGVTDVLTGGVSLREALREVRTQTTNSLTVITGGARTDQPLSLIKSRQVRSLLARLREEFDCVIVDAACAAAHPDAQVLGTMADGVLLVVRAARTPRESVAEVKKRLDLARVRCLGIVLNQRRDPIPDLLYRMT